MFNRVFIKVDNFNFSSILELIPKFLEILQNLLV
jgi:hypothetical protein